jgi:hypothetical protein
VLIQRDVVCENERAMASLLADNLLTSKDLPRVSTTRSGQLSFGGGSNGSLRDAYLKGRIQADLIVLRRTQRPSEASHGRSGGCPPPPERRSYEDDLWPSSFLGVSPRPPGLASLGPPSSSSV